MDQTAPQKDNQSYYDEFSASYEKERHHGYHVMLDELETSLVHRYLAPHMRVLEVGCGTGLILQRLAPHAAQVVGMDLSRGMLGKAHARAFHVVQANANELPFADQTFDVVCSFKVLAHVEAIQQTLQGCARVLKPGGRLIAEFYNPTSLRGLIKRWKKPTAISTHTTDAAVYTRYDTLAQIRSYLPPELTLEAVRGIRIWTPTSSVHNWPVIGPVVRWLERTSADAPGLRRLGGFLAVVVRKMQ